LTNSYFRHAQKDACGAIPDLVDGASYLLLQVQRHIDPETNQILRILAELISVFAAYHVPEGMVSHQRST
jgi:hypothetical protein